MFSARRPVVGGRGSEGLCGPGASCPTTSTFQGRYIIRHYWAGEVKCDDPTWGR
ncbi:MAG: hypothetical protein R3F43_01000 [bacterium]